MRLLRTLLASFRVRLVLAFMLVVTVALALVVTTLPRLLDGYFAQQEQANLQVRADLMSTLVAAQLLQVADLDPALPTPILSPTDPLTPGDTVYRALERSGYVADLARNVAYADVRVTISELPTSTVPVYELIIQGGDAAAEHSQTSASSSTIVPDLWWSANPAGAKQRLLTVTLSNPITSRSQTSAAIAGVLAIAALIALVVAVVASVLLAQWLTSPVRRLTHAARALAEGRLEARVAVPPTGSPELAELAASFNHMAERLQDSIGIISADRDRSREFLADVSHDSRTPIAALRTFNELLRDGAAEDPETRDEFLEQSARQIERLDWLATNLLELSKLDSGLVALDLRPDDMRAVVENAVQQAQPLAERKDIDLVVHLPDRPVRQLHDPPRVGQVLNNLIGNAIKFTPNGGRVDVELTPSADGAELSVTDTGVGITAEEMPHVFERFWRGSRTPEQRGIGSGLGLAIVRSIVDMHQGRINIVSTPGTGTRVAVDLPRSMSLSSPSGPPA